MARSNVIELFSRLITPQDRKDKIYCNGADNLYPERIERIINNSVTAKLAAEKLQDFLIGLGFDEDIMNVIVNDKKRLRFYDILKRIARDLSYHKGAYIHINYDVDGVPNYLDVLKYKYCRISEEDDFDNLGYVWFSKKWDAVNNVLTVQRNKKKKNWFYPYNPNIDVINAQRRNDSNKGEENIEKLIRNYRGQVFFLNLEDDSIYPNSWIDPAYNDADTEYHLSLFRNDRIKTGFLGANIVIVPTDDDNGAKITDEELKSLLGSENSSNILKLEVTPEGDKKLEDYIHIETIKSEVDTEQFQYDEGKIQENILNCFKNVPKILVKNTDSALFGPNAESLRTAQLIYQEETTREREAIARALNMIFKKTEYEDRFEIIPLYDPEENREEDVDTEE